MSTDEQAADTLATLLRVLDEDTVIESGLTPVVYRDHVGDTVFVTINGVGFQIRVEAT